MPGLAGCRGGNDCFPDEKFANFRGKSVREFHFSVVKNEILMVKEGLIKALNDRVGDNVVKDIVVF